MRISLTSGSVGPLTRSVHDVYRALKACDDLRPCPHVDGLFGRLVGLALACPPASGERLLGHRRIRSLRADLHQLRARGEQELELSWARRIATSPAPHDQLA